jgi:Na+/proline symporter
MSPWIIIATIALYLAVLFAVAFASARKADNQAFFVGGRRSPWAVVAFGMIGAAMSGVTFVSVPGMVGVSGFSYLQMAMGFVVGYMVIAFVLVPLFYRMNITSIYQYLDDRFGVSSYRTGAWLFFVSKMLGAAVKIYLVCLVLQLLVFEPLGVSFVVNVVIIMTLVWLYTFRGGVRSIVWTDTLKTFFLVGSVGLSIYFIARALDLDFGRMVSTIRDSELSRVFFFDDINDRRYFFKQFFSGLFVVVAMTGLDQDMMQRSHSCRSPRDSQKNLVVSTVLQFVVIAMFLCLGVLLNSYVEVRGLVAPAAGDELFPFVATGTGLPSVVGILFVLGLVSSTYSSAGSALTALTTSFTVDILGGTRKYNDGRLTRVRRLVHIGMAVAMAVVIVAFRVLNNTSVIDAVFVLASYTYGPILGMFAFGIATRRAVRDRWVPVVAVASPVLCLVLDLNSEAWLGGYRFSYELLILNALFTIIGLIILVKPTKYIR